MLDTHWEQEKKNSPHPTPKKENQGPSWVMLGLPIGCMKFVFPKLFVTFFGLG
jgi:hypothetical protein